MKKIITIFFCGLSCAAAALDPNHFTITRISAPYFVVDGNSPATINQAYVGFEIKNNSNSATTYSGLKFTITSIGTSVVGQNFTLVSPANGITNIGTLAPGESRVCYYYVSYPASTTPQATFNVQLSDNTVSWKTTSFLIKNRSSISANAGGTATQSFTNQDLIGGLVYDDVTYAVGNVQNGDEADFQVAVSTQFDPTKVLLLGTQVTSSTVPGIATGTTDSLYYITGNGSNGATVTIRWTFRISATNFTTYLLPCAGATSGSTNYKYALNTALGQGTPITVSSSANPLTISKTSDKTVYGPGGLAVFTVTITNPGAYPVTIDRITDQIPTGFAFTAMDAASQVTATNSTTVPTVGATGTITFDGGVSSGSVNSYNILAGGTLILKYKATAPLLPASNLVTTARDYVGTTEVGNSSNTVSVSNTLPVVMNYFNGKWAGTETNLYWGTSNEINSKAYEVERSTDNRVFSRVGLINAAGISVAAQNYSFTDISPADENYYRLKLVDIDGKFSYSPVIRLSRKLLGLSVQQAYPNPFRESLQLKLNTDKQQKVEIKIFDQAGRQVYKKTEDLTRGENLIILEPSISLTSGMYLVRIETGSGSMEQKIIKQ